jgi:hypothetical protein
MTLAIFLHGTTFWLTTVTDFSVILCRRFLGLKDPRQRGKQEVPSRMTLYEIHETEPFFVIFYNNKQINNYLIEVYITTEFPCIIYIPTCFDILCYHQGVTYLLLAKLHKSLHFSCWI